MILDDILKQASSYLRNYNDDVVDRFHYVYSVAGLAIYLVFLTSKQYYGEMIQCNFNKGAFDGDTIKYIHSMCWLNGTSQFNRNSYSEMDFTPVRKLNYYQWMTFIIVFKIFLFRIPGFLWSIIIYLNGFDIVHVTKIIMGKLYLDEYIENSKYSSTQKAIQAISDHLTMTFLKQKFVVSKKFNEMMQQTSRESDRNKIKESPEDKAQQRRIQPNLKTKSSFPLFVPYILVIKLTYLALVVVNFYFLSQVFQFNFMEYGLYMINKYFVLGDYSSVNDYFPKNSMCDVIILSKHDYLPHSLICTLPINLFNEIFYFLYWFWLLFLLVTTTFSIFYWCLLTIRPYRRHLVMQALQIEDEKITSSYMAAYYFGQDKMTTYEQADGFLREKTGLGLRDNFELFFRHVCSIDVIFALKIIALNSNSLAIRDILNNLWYSYLDLADTQSKLPGQRPVLAVKRTMIPPATLPSPEDQKMPEKEAQV